MLLALMRVCTRLQFSKFQIFNVYTLSTISSVNNFMIVEVDPIVNVVSIFLLITLVI